MTVTGVRFGGFYPLTVKTPDGRVETDLRDAFDAIAHDGWGDEVAAWVNIFGRPQDSYAVFRHKTPENGEQLVMVTDDAESRDCTDVLGMLTVEQNIAACQQGVLPDGLLDYKMGEGNVTPMEVTYNEDIGTYGFANPFYELKFTEEAQS